ncbi:MAG: preprotein translocase subunit YajC [Campylobacterales bacterium]|nr:preprotein translocase subunit YajC [Campylobacterales bacterium]
MENEPSVLASLLPLIVLFGIFYLLVILPQQRQNKKHKETIESLKKGDKILTTGGIHGEVEKVEEEFFKVKIADDTVVKLEKEFIVKKLGEDEK